jgi:hypothetical protein
VPTANVLAATTTRRRRSGLDGAVVLTQDPSSGGDAPVRPRGLTPDAGPAPPTGGEPGACRTAGPGGRKGPVGRRRTGPTSADVVSGVRPAVVLLPPRKAEGRGAAGRSDPVREVVTCSTLPGTGDHVDLDSVLSPSG